MRRPLTRFGRNFFMSGQVRAPARAFSRIHLSQWQYRLRWFIARAGAFKLPRPRMEHCPGQAWAVLRLGTANKESTHEPPPPATCQLADVNQDGGVDFFDIDPFLACLFGACP